MLERNQIPYVDRMVWLDKGTILYHEARTLLRFSQLWCMKRASRVFELGNAMY